MKFTIGLVVIAFGFLIYSLIFRRRDALGLASTNLRNRPLTDFRRWND